MMGNLVQALAKAQQRIAEEKAARPVYVRRGWNDALIVPLHFGDLQDLHWRSGISPYSPRPFLHGQVLCSRVQHREFAHSCEPRSAPHQILVCIARKDNARVVYEELAGRAPTGASISILPTSRAIDSRAHRR